MELIGLELGALVWWELFGVPTGSTARGLLSVTVFAARSASYDYQTTGSGRLVVFGHGLGCDRALFDEQVRFLSDRFECVTFDWPGHGHSTTFDTAGWTLEDLADDVTALLEHLGSGPAVLVGLSQGGMVFMRVALDHPDLVGGLVLLDTSARAESPDHAAAVKVNLDWLREASEDERAGFVRETAIPAFFAQPWRDTHADEVEREIALRLGHDPFGYELAVRAVVDRLPLDLERLAEIDVPVAIVVGEFDQLTPVDHARELCDAISGAALTVVPGAGHHTPIEKPGEVNAAVEALLARAF